MSNEDKEMLGRDIVSFCGKCKLVRAHVVVTVDSAGDSEKCECRTCGAVHRYKNPEKPKKVRRSSGKAAKKVVVSIETLWKDAMSGAKGSSKNYEMTSGFDKGDLIAHSTFGAGVVQELIGCNRMWVIFSGSEKLLIHKRPPPLPSPPKKPWRSKSNGLYRHA